MTVHQAIPSLKYLPYDFFKILYRTIIHDFESALCYYVVAGGLSSKLGHLIRMIFGPMPEFVCWWIIFCKNTIVHGIQLSMDFNIVFRVGFSIQIRFFLRVEIKVYPLIFSTFIWLY